MGELPQSVGLSLEDFAAENGVKYFLVSYTDLFGAQRSKLVPSQAIAAMQAAGAGFAGYSTHLDMTAAHPDMFAVPDPSSVIQLPWKRQVAWVASNLYMNGEEVAQAPRNILRAQIEKAKAGGYEMKTGVECEFFLLTANTPFEPRKNAAADINDTAEKPCYDQGALMRKYDVIAEICDHMLHMGWKPYQNDHEDGNGQFEMNWEYDSCLLTADRHAFFKFMVKSVAEKHGMRATFMPKPFADKTGNGAHCHVSLWDGAGSNLFEEEGGELGLSRLAYNFLGGVLMHAKALCAVTNPTVNSYKRIDGSSTASGSSWAPCSISYTGNNRTHMLRIPAGGRFELRLADGAVNPYLLQAGMLAAGLDGIERQTDPGPRCDWNGHLPHHGKELPSLPSCLLDALRELEKSDFAAKWLGAEFVEAYVKLRKQQWNAYTSHLSQWELDNTLDC